jgi:hypothetical protein
MDAAEKERDPVAFGEQTFRPGRAEDGEKAGTLAPGPGSRYRLGRRLGLARGERDDANGTGESVRLASRGRLRPLPNQRLEQEALPRQLDGRPVALGRRREGNGRRSWRGPAVPGWGTVGSRSVGGRAFADHGRRHDAGYRRQLAHRGLPSFPRARTRSTAG